MKRFLRKIILALIIGFNLARLLAIGHTFAYYNDEETSLGNNFQATTLDFSLSSSQDNFGPWPAVTLNMMPGASVSREVKIRNEGSLSFQYNARTEKISGDDDFCQGLKLIAELEEVIKYNGSLMGFKFSAVEISGSEDNWLFIISLPYGSNFVNKVCQFKFVFEGRQINSSSGFSDQEEISSKLASWGLRINEVYYDVAGNHGQEGDNEWVEIYNQTNQAIDISGWKICDNTFCDTIPASDPIPAEGFAVITATSTTWNFWTIPHPAIKIVLKSKIGNGLHNDKDRVILQRPDGTEITEIDAISYGNDNYAFDPPCTDVDGGHSLARRIAGFDTNQASDWEDLTNPTPGTNPHSQLNDELLEEEALVEEISGEEEVEETSEEIAEGQAGEETDSQEANTENIVNENQEGLDNGEEENFNEEGTGDPIEGEISATEDLGVNEENNGEELNINEENGFEVKAVDEALAGGENNGGETPGEVNNRDRMTEGQPGKVLGGDQA